MSHYKKGEVFDSIVEESFATSWAKAKTEWRLEREGDLVSIPGSVMVPDFRLVHPDGRTFVLEIVGYWRPEYLRKKFSQVARSNRNDIILMIFDRLNLGGVCVKVHQTPAAREGNVLVELSENELDGDVGRAAQPGRCSGGKPRG